MKLAKIPKHIWWAVFFPLVLVGLGIWRLWPEIEEYRGEDEREAISSLSLVAHVEDSFKRGDHDTNGVKDFWTGDVSDLFRLYNSTGNVTVAEADIAPLTPLVPQPVPWNGYYFVALKRDRSSVPPEEYQQVTDKSGRRVHHLSRFGFCAYPARYDWRHRRTFIINQGWTIFSVNNGGKPVTDWPTDEELADRFTEVKEPAEQVYDLKWGE